MTAPKSLEWRGYRFVQREAEGSILARVSVYRGDEWVASESSVEAAKAYVRALARARLADAQAEFDRVMEGE